MSAQMDPAPASYYGKLDKSNPVITAFDSDIKEFKSYIKRAFDSSTLNHHFYSRGSKKLFETWSKYQPRLPSHYFEDNLLQIADFLLGCKLYRLAVWQGYGRYLQQISTVSIENIKDVYQFQSSFFPEGLHTEKAQLTFRALQGLCMCTFHLETESKGEPHHKAVCSLLSILGFLRVMMQAALPHESLCWLVYNGSLCIYNICRYLMSVNRCVQALEYLLWSCACLETSIPLLTPVFLPWRATLYVAVCQCYYDAQAGVQAEVFARRALGKISELRKLEEMTGSPATPVTQRAFKEATIKMAVMVFKRSVFEPRRKPKGVLRPKPRSNLKETQSIPWPRTPTERVLMELFEGNAAQFLAVLEALWDSARRPLQTGCPDDPEDQEVALELMAAGASILSGVGGSPERVRNDSLPPPLCGITLTFTLMEMAAAGENRISVEAAVTFAKLLFRYEQWDMFGAIAAPLLPVLSNMDDGRFRKAELELRLLEAVVALMSSQRVRSGVRDGLSNTQTEKDRLLALPSLWEEFLALAQTLHWCVCQAEQDVWPDGDLVLDVVLLLWRRCKVVFQRAQMGHWDPMHFLTKLEKQDKWVQTLYLLTEVAHAAQLAQTDPVLVSEMALRLAMVLENNADTPSRSGRKTAATENSSQDSTLGERYTSPLFKGSRSEQLQIAWNVLEFSMEGVSSSRAKSLPRDSSAVCDVVFLQRFGREGLRFPAGAETENTCSPSLGSLFADLHLDLLALQHRVALKLLDADPGEQQEVGGMTSAVMPGRGDFQDAESARVKAESVLLEKIRKNRISKALFFTQKALLSHQGDMGSAVTRKLLEEATALMEKAEVEERKLLNLCAPQEKKPGPEEKSKPPPAPILLSRTEHSMTFTPAPYALEDQVCWYCVFGREAEGANLKVRLGDCSLAGAGEMVPSRGERVLQVSGLEPNQRYMFAVAAYDAQGNIVGGGIGDNTRPLLVSLPFPLLTTWAHLAQVAYQTGQHQLAKRACSKLWGHFTQSPPPGPRAQQETWVSQASEGLANTRLHQETLQASSPLLQQLFLSSVFIQTDIHVQEGALYCDALSDRGPLIFGQEARLEGCERLLVAVDLALHLNDSSAALQAVVGCYGLLAPLVFHQILSEAAVQVLLKCLMVLQEIPGVLKQKQPTAMAESLQHMVACITYYVAKGLRSFKELGMASAVVEQGKRLLQEIMDAPAPPPPSKPPQVQQVKGSKLQKKPLPVQEEQSEELKALEASAMTQGRGGASPHHDSIGDAAAEGPTQELTGLEDPALLYSVIENTPLTSAFRDVMRFKRRSCFLEFAVCLLQRAFVEDHLEHAVEWGQEIFHWLARRDEGLTGQKKTQVSVGGRELKRFTSSVIEYSTKKGGGSSLSSYKRKKMDLQKKQVAALKAQSTDRESKAVESLRAKLAALVLRRQFRRRLRQISSAERIGRCHANLVMARAYLGLLCRSLEPRQGLAPQHRYSQMAAGFFSLAHCGTLVKWRNVPQHVGPPELPLPPTLKFSPQPQLKAKGRKNREHRERAASSSGEESIAAEGEAESEPDTPRTQQTNESDGSEPPPSPTMTPTQHTAPQPLDTLNMAAVHLRRAMVLAHRGGHWTSLQWVCRLLWDQLGTLGAPAGERGQSAETPFTLTSDQLHTALTPLLALAADLLMDMMQSLQLWAAYDDEDAGELEASLSFSAPLDEGSVVDLRWVRVLTLHTLELLHHQARWETLAHLAMRYNSYTRERYSVVITPLLVHAQRRLLERVRHFGGPPPPQAHFTHTEAIGGEKITCRNYGGRQLLLPLSPSAERQRGGSATPEPLEQAEVRRAVCLVCVPLDVEETLRCFRQSLSKLPHSLLALRHGRLLLRLLLAHTQPTLEMAFCKESNRVEFNMAASAAPTTTPPDLSTEDFSSLSSIYSPTLPPSLIQMVFSAYNSSVEYLQANNQNSLRVQALHDLGNLHFYNGNRRAAHSNWSKALDCALQRAGALDSWDGIAWGNSTSLQVLRHSGIWGCLQGALLTAKIGQYILTSTISQRTKCCLLSAQLFKCLLRASLPHPQTDLQYSSYSVGSEVIPGVDLFSEPERANLGSTVASLGFVCHWLYSTGHYPTVLPLLALYLHIVGTVCRDAHLSVGGRILKVKTLTELGLYGEAVRELSRLTVGEEIPQPQGCYRTTDRQVSQNEFLNHKPLMDPANLQALEDVVNGRPGGDVMVLYGPGLSRRLLMARVQLLLALCSAACCLPEPPEADVSETLCEEGGSLARSSSTPSLSSPPSREKQDSPCSTPAQRVKEASGLRLHAHRDKLTLGQLKALLLKEASSLLAPQLSSTRLLLTKPEELELAVEARLLLAEINLQQGKSACSADQAVSALRLLQDSPMFQTPLPQTVPGPPSSALRQPKAQQSQAGPREAAPPPSDVPQTVEAMERMGPSLWLRCRLAAVRGLAALIPGAAISPGADSSVRAERLIREGLEEVEAWGDPDTQALLLLQWVSLHTQRGRARQDSSSLLQEAVSLLSGRGALSVRSALALTRASLLLSGLRGSSGQPLLLLTQTLLQQQLCAFGESVVIKDGGVVLLPPVGLKSMYHPQLPLLARATMRLGHCLALQAQASPSEVGPWKPWLAALEVLQAALHICRASAAQEGQLEADILYCMGLVRRCLVDLQQLPAQMAAETFLECITITLSHCHNLQLTRRCYLELALMYLQQWEQSGPTQQERPAPLPPSAKQCKKTQTWKRVRSSFARSPPTGGEAQLLLFWVCMRAATNTAEAIANCAHLGGIAEPTEGPLPLTSLKSLPDFAFSDLLTPCGQRSRMALSFSQVLGVAVGSSGHTQLTWVHLSRYHTHLHRLLHVSTQPVVPECVEGLLSEAGDCRLLLRHTQLHRFLICHLPGYREQCVVPQPPADLIRQPQVPQPVPDPCRRATAEQQELSIQWHRPALEVRQSQPNTILLLFGLNMAPVSAVPVTTSSISQLQKGKRLLCLHRLRAAHAQLRSACMAAGALDGSTAGSATPAKPKQEPGGSGKIQLDQAETSSPYQQVLLEKTLHCCMLIRDLLQPSVPSASITEVPFETTLQTLCHLERCFDPAGGATLVGKALTDWLLSLLLPDGPMASA